MNVKWWVSNRQVKQYFYFVILKIKVKVEHMPCGEMFQTVMVVTNSGKTQRCLFHVTLNEGPTTNRCVYMCDCSAGVACEAFRIRMAAQAWGVWNDRTGWVLHEVEGYYESVIHVSI